MTSPAISYEQQLKARYAGILAKTRAAPTRAVKASNVVVLPKREETRPSLPMWRTEHIRFDAHVLAWQVATFVGTTGAMKTYVLRRCDELNVEFEEIIKNKLNRTRSTARNIILYELRTRFEPAPSYPELGRLFGFRHHSTIIAAVRHGSKALNSPEIHKLTSMERLTQIPRLAESVKSSFDAGMPLEAIAEANNLSIDAFRKFIEKKGWERERISGSTPPTTAIPHKQALKIKEAYLSYMPIREICLKFDVSERSISRLRTKYGWGLRPRKVTE